MHRTKSSRNTVLFLTALSITTSALAGCTSPGASTSTSSKGAIVVSSAAPLVSPAFQIPEFKAGMDAAVSSINANGGVAGHQLNLDFCDTTFSVNGEISCARKAVAAKSAAILAPIFFLDQSGATWETLEAANMPVVGSLGGSPAELTMSNVFLQTGGAPAVAYGCIAAALNAGATKLRVVMDTSPTAGFFSDMYSDALASAGVTPLPTVTADLTSDPTLSTAASQAIADGADGLILAGPPTVTVKLIAALRSAGYDGAISAQSGIPANALTALGSAGDGLLITSGNAAVSDTSNTGVSAFLADMAEYQKAAPVNDWSLQGWTAVRLFAAGAADVQEFDSSSVLAAFDGVSTPIDIGTIAPWLIAGQTSPLPAFPRILNPSVSISSVTDGIVVAKGGFIDPFTELSNR
jgi:branched-chain amino acid transport system substrate-binding protein